MTPTPCDCTSSKSITDTEVPNDSVKDKEKYF